MLDTACHAHEIPDAERFVFDHCTARNDERSMHVRMRMCIDTRIARKAQHLDEQTSATMIDQRFGFTFVAASLPRQPANMCFARSRWR